MTPATRQDLGLILWQVRYEQRSYWRNRGRGIFTFVFPLMFLVIFGSIDQGARLARTRLEDRPERASEDDEREVEPAVSGGDRRGGGGGPRTAR